MMKKILKNILTVFLFSASPYFFVQPVSGQRYGPEQKITVEQNFPAAVRPGSDFMLEIKINKGNVSGLAKFQQYVPLGMTATPMENAGADFSFESQNVKLIWTSVPQNEVITLRYKITVAPTLTGKKYLSGTFSYVENDRTKKISLVPKEIDITADAPAVELATTGAKPVKDEVQPEKTEAPPAIQKEESQPQPVQAEVKTEPATFHVFTPGTTPAVAETKKQVEAPVETAAPTPTVTDEKKVQPVESPVKVEPPVSMGITFRVQIAAMNEKRFRRKNYFQEKFGLQMEVTAEVHDGLKKYTVGNFGAYSQARKLREEILSSVGDSFVVAYKDGVRIPVPEAMEMLRKK